MIQTWILVWRWVTHGDVRCVIDVDPWQLNGLRSHVTHWNGKFILHDFTDKAKCKPRQPTFRGIRFALLLVPFTSFALTSDSAISSVISSTNALGIQPMRSSRLSYNVAHQPVAGRAVVLELATVRILGEELGEKSLNSGRAEGVFNAGNVPEKDGMYYTSTSMCTERVGTSSSRTRLS